MFFLNLNYPFHSYLHTFNFAFFFGLSIGFAMFYLETFLRPLYKLFLLEQDDTSRMNAFLVASAFSTMRHVLFETPMYPAIQSFFSITMNPLYNSVSLYEIYIACFWLGILGLIFYASLALLHIYEKQKNG